MVEALASRPQLQERLGEQVVAAVQDGLEARGVLVVLDAQHQCVTTRGERQTGSTTVTVAASGILSEAAGRAEAIALIGAGTGNGTAAAADAGHGTDA
ncbi:GTP cyclohydrolase I [Curtobacterium sp. MCJR17_043]|uniref:GTP cyclohydrolase I n=1 Tax=Curtobacterium sp. MCJR17_043 TaxID=2175660 RepID=UPI0032E8C01E